MSSPIVSIDLHGLFQEEAIKVIDKALINADDSTYQIKLIHGYNRDTSLKNMIIDEYKYHPKVLRVQPVITLEQLYSFCVNYEQRR